MGRIPTRALSGISLLRILAGAASASEHGYALGSRGVTAVPDSQG
jgi:hypothetical protein